MSDENTKPKCEPVSPKETTNLNEITKSLATNVKIENPAPDSQEDSQDQEPNAGELILDEMMKMMS